MSSANKNPKKDPFICSCNGIPQSTIEDAMSRGCTTLNKVFDATTAGCGPCGGSCRPILKKMLEHYLKTGQFLANPKPKRKARS